MVASFNLKVANISIDYFKIKIIVIKVNTVTRINQVCIPDTINHRTNY